MFLRKYYIYYQFSPGSISGSSSKKSKDPISNNWDIVGKESTVGLMARGKAGSRNGVISVKSYGCWSDSESHDGKVLGVESVDAADATEPEEDSPIL